MKTTMTYLLIMIFLMSCSKSENGGEQENSMVADMEADTDDGQSAEQLPVLMGEFVDGAHPTSGLVTVNAFRNELVIKDFKSDDGPILELYLASDVQASEYTTLGVLKGLEGDFSYTIPKEADFEKQKYVLVWCVEFAVSFGHAELE